MLTRQSSKRSSSEEEPSEGGQLAAPPPLSSGLTRIFDDGMQVSKKPKTVSGINDAKQSARWANRRAEIRAKRDANKVAAAQGETVANKAAATQPETKSSGPFSTIKVSSSDDTEQSKAVSQPGPSNDPRAAAYSDDTQPAFIQTMDDVMNLRVDKLAKHLMGGKSKK